MLQFLLTSLTHYFEPLTEFILAQASCPVYGHLQPIETREQKMNMRTVPRDNAIRHRETTHHGLYR